MQDRLDLYTDDVMKNQSVSGGADEDVHKEILRILDKALEATRRILKGVKCAKSVPPRSLDVIPERIRRPCMI